MRKPLIFAVDFDGTLCSYNWPDIGEPNKKLIQDLICRRAIGDKVVLWTCRANEKLDEAVAWCKKHGLEFDAINDNLPNIKKSFGVDSRKIFANYYIDDRALNPEEIW
jgi:hypothetical protein